jgi:hypothetical protein
LDSPALFVRRTLRGGLAVACVGCAALAAAGLRGWAIGAALGAAVALGNFWLLARVVLRLSGAPDAAARGRRAAWQGAALRFVLAGAVLGLAIFFLPVHPLGVAAGLVGVHAAMAVVWVVTSLAGIGSPPTPPGA